jgi:RNA polymerase sigma factor (sigma-70 family)
MLSEKEFINAVEENRNIIFKVCNMYMNSPAERKDLFQEILLNAWKGIKNYKGDAKFSTWLYRVALNTSITYYKKFQKTKSEQSAEADILVNVEQPGYEDEQVSAMNMAINELSTIEKALVMLYLDDYSHQQIAEIMGITPNLVAVKMNRIKARLRETSKKYL